ncbi:MAG TPA: SMI1/KNR4 family protein [Blastocatellia bacterium]
MGNYRQLSQLLVGQWREEGIPLNSGATESEFYALEKALGISLPEDFRYFYSLTNGMTDMESDRYFFSLWPLARIYQALEANETNRVSVSDRKQIAFGDMLIDSYRYLLTFTEQQVYVSTEMVPSEELADSFEEFIQNYLAEPEKLYLTSN